MVNWKGGGAPGFQNLGYLYYSVGSSGFHLDGSHPGKPRVGTGISLWLPVQLSFWPWDRQQECVAQAVSTLG